MVAGGPCHAKPGVFQIDKAVQFERCCFIHSLCKIVSGMVEGGIAMFKRAEWVNVFSAERSDKNE